MSAHNPSAMGATGQPAPAVPIYVAVCSLMIILALALGVGLTVNQVLRHLVQTAPFWGAVVLGFRRSRAAYWVALPLFLFWLVLMALIWAYLLDISHIVNGHFSPIEISMTIVVGVAGILGIASLARSKSSLSLATKLGLFVAFLAIQLVCLRISFLPSIAHR